MADLFNTGIFNNLLSGAGALASGVKIGAMIFLYLSPFILGMILILHLSRFKHQITIRKKTKDKTDVVTVTKFRVVKKQGQPVEIKTLKEKLTLPIPPENAIEITDKGKMYVEAYVSEGGEATFLEVTAKVETVQLKESELVQKKDKKGQPLFDGKGNPIYERVERTVFKDVQLTRLRTMDKAFYFNREKLAEQKYKMHTFWSFLNQHGGAIIMLIFVAMIFIFFGDVMEPAIRMSQANNNYNAEMLAKWDGVLDRVDQLVNQRQRLELETHYNTTEPIRAPE